MPLYEWDKKVTVCTDTISPYLDMELFWNHKDDLSFRIHVKPNQELKYLNNDSTHSKACFKAIPVGVQTRLAKLTSHQSSNKQLPLDELYPPHLSREGRSSPRPSAYLESATLQIP
jgi:hypothetical protein